MKYKALFTDFDNTLAGEDGVIPLAVTAELKRLIGKGLIISIATGRAYTGRIAQVAAELGLRHPLVTHNGAEIIDPVNSQILRASYISRIRFQQLLHFFKQEDLVLLLSKNGHYYAEEPMEIPFGVSNRSVFAWTETELDHIPVVLIPARYSKLSRDRADVLEKILVHLFPELHIIKMKIGEYYGFDITSLEATKHTGALEVLTLLRLHKDETVGVGDNFNDYPLLMACGTKVAMGDAPEELKAIADFVAPAQQEQGFLKVLEKYFS